MPTKVIQTIQAALLLSLFALSTPFAMAQEQPELNPEKSVARNWNEALLFAIRLDLARPTVHARNLFHSSAAMYDGWAVFDTTASTWFLGHPERHGTACSLTTEQRNALRESVTDLAAARQSTISHALYRLLNHRFAQSPGKDRSLQLFSDLFAGLGFDSTNTEINIGEGATPATLGNYLAECVIKFGQSDGANEQNNYSNQFYSAINTPLNPATAGTPGLIDPNRWQPLQIDNFIDQSGNNTALPVFLSAEWGRVTPFALSSQNLTNYTRDGNDYPVYHDPGPPALLRDSPAANADYLWGHSLVALWSSHLDPSDGVTLDISPASLGNTDGFTYDLANLRDYYNRQQGGSLDTGYTVNPKTGLPYEPQVVPRGDYTRVLAEFWADGPDSETPPGHWFSIYNEAVSDHPDFETRFGGEGEELGNLEFDVRTYFILGGAMHDSAITAWGIKGWYDYIRPISALRYMSSLGQSTDTGASNYDPGGVPLEEGFIEVVKEGDFLAGNTGTNIGKIKVRAWRGPNFINDPDTDTAGVGWILLDNWWPYQRPTFVTPPFAGYVSGHSTFSRAAAEVLTRITGDAFFPGGMGEFIARKNEFLVFEEGPSVDVKLQWATYRDASDQTSLSRIWGGIHPPVDDLPGRVAGISIANDAFDLGVSYVNGNPGSDPGDNPGQGVNNDDPVQSAGGGGGCALTAGRSEFDPLFPLLLLLLVAKTRLKRKKYRTQCF